MANRRDLKKQVRYICGEIAGECIMAKYILPGVDAEKFNDIVCDLAELQTTAIARSNVSFDKTPRDFANVHEYRKARRAYYAAAYKALQEGFAARLDEVVKAMNAAAKKQ